MKTQSRISVILLATLAALAAWSAPGAADPARTRSVEDTLLNDLRPGQLPPAGSRSLDAQRRAGASSFAPARVNRRSFWAEELGIAGVSEDVLPLLSVAQQMRDVQSLLGRAECGTATQHAQRQILDSLDRLLQHAQQCRGAASAGTCSKSAENQPTDSAAPCDKPPGTQKPGAKPGTSPDNTGKTAAGASGRPQTNAPRVDPGQRRAMLKQLWGELPPRRRQQMLQLPVEEFLPRYEIMIEDYFRRLSEEKQQQAPGRHRPTRSP